MKRDGHCGPSKDNPPNNDRYINEASIKSHISIDRILWHPILGTVDQVPTHFKEWRIMRDYTLRQVEDVTGISNSYLSQLETGKVTNPSFATVVKLCELYMVKIII